jgi:hypothetical protein
MAAKQVHMIVNSAHDQRGAIQVLANARHVCVQIVPNFFLFQESNPVLGGKHDVEINLSQGL